MLASDRAPTTATISAPAHAPHDSLGCQASKLSKSQELVASGLRVHRKLSQGSQVGRVETPPTGRGFLVGVALRGGHTRHIYEGRQATLHAFEQNAVYVRDFADPYRAELHGAFDFLLLEVPHAAIDHVVEEAGGSRLGGLTGTTAARDDVLAHLAGALAPALEQPAHASALFVDQMGVVIATHLVQRYGRADARPETVTRVLSRGLEARAKELLRSKMNGDISIAEIADACQLSRSYFINAFRQTTGHTPHQWLVEQRIQRARTLLQSSDTALADIAASCGFADQSHFSRVFTRSTGMPPGQWRRQART